MIRLLVAFLVLCLTTHHAFADEYAAVRGREGFWRVAKTPEGVWWFLNPEGRREFLTTVTTIQPNEASWVENGPHFKSRDFNGNIDEWAEKTARRVSDYGFKAIGAWSNRALLKHLPMAIDLNISDYPTVPIEHDDWPRQVEEAVKMQVEKLKDEKNIIGYYLDNEMDWWKLEPHAARYYKVTCEAVRKHDPNHLILGVRYNRFVPDSVVKASKGWVDTHSINQYSDDGKFWWAMFKQLNELSDCPIIISEFSFYSDDNRSGCKNTKGFGGKVATSADRARMYRFTVGEIAKCPFVIGADWFQWNDEPPDGRSGKNHANLREDVAFGVVDIFDRPYDDLVEAVKEMKPKVNELHQVGGPSKAWK